MTASGTKGTRLRRIGAGLAVSALVATASGLGLASAAPLGAQVGAAATTEDAAALISITPTRVLDTRTSSPLGQGQTLDVKLTSPGPVPADGVGAVLNVTLDGATAKSFITVWPAGEARPLASTNNAEPGLVTPNSVTAKLGANGSVSVYNANGSTNVVIDVVGYLVPMDKVVVSGSQFWVGTAAPTTSQGKEGDTYFDSLAKVLYGPKDANGWGEPVNLAGQQGAVGAMGPQGPIGVSGDAGPQGPEGPTGPVSTTPGPQGPKAPKAPSPPPPAPKAPKAPPDPSPPPPDPKAPKAPRTRLHHPRTPRPRRPRRPRLHHPGTGRTRRSDAAHLECSERRRDDRLRGRPEPSRHPAAQRLLQRGSDPAEPRPRAADRSGHPDERHAPQPRRAHLVESEPRPHR